MTWPHVAIEYGNLFRSWRRRARSSSCRRRETLAQHAASPPLDHLLAMTDGTGVIQHATETVPEPVDRLLHRRRGARVHRRVDAARIDARDETAHRLAVTYLSFLYDAQIEDGRFHNFMRYDRAWLDEVGTHDSFGRALWALGLRHTARARRRLAAPLPHALRAWDVVDRMAGASAFASVRDSRAWRTRTRRCASHRMRPRCAISQASLRRVSRPSERGLAVVRNEHDLR